LSRHCHWAIWWLSVMCQYEDARIDYISIHCYCSIEQVLAVKAGWVCAQLPPAQPQ
jgi:hypothetical protein